MPVDPEDMDERKLNEILKRLENEREDKVLDEAALQRAVSNIRKIARDSGDSSQDLSQGQKNSNESNRIGPYKLLQKIGEGGMGTVWMAEQTEPIRRKVALKLVKGGADSKNVIARFEAERQALAMMDHQNIAKVLDAGMTEDGRPYFAMELVEGIPITEYCDENKLPLIDRLELFVPVCQAVQHAHQKGIIHRDLKPSNVLVTLYDGRPVSKVIDFGLAKALQHQTRLTDKTLFTEFGQVVGTLQYMSPEQAEMNALNVDTRTDVYSMGVMLYELLTGTTPLEKETIGENALLKIIQAIKETDPPRPSARLSESGDAIKGISEQRKIAPAKLQHILRGELDWIVMKALEKDRTRRYVTANDFANDIQRYLNDDTVEARPPSTVYRLKKFIRRNRSVVASAAVVILIVGIATAGLSVQRVANQKKLELTQAESDRERAASLVESVVVAPPEAIPYAIKNLEPLRDYAVPILDNILEQPSTSNARKLQAAFALAELDEVDSEIIVNSIAFASSDQCANFVRALGKSTQGSIALLKQQAVSFENDENWRAMARVAMVLLCLGDDEVVKAMCQLREDPIQRTWFIEECSTWHGDLTRLAAISAEMDNGPTRSAVALAVGSVPIENVASDQIKSWEPVLSNWFKNEPDSLTHSASGWALRKWKLGEPEIASTRQPTEKQQWHVNGMGMTMLKIPSGSFVRKVGKDKSIEQTVTLTRSFLLADRELTLATFQQFIDDPNCPNAEKPDDWKVIFPEYSPTEHHPAQQINWYDAIMFCNWLSRRERLAPCYERTGKREKSGFDNIEHDTWRLIPETNGYRLPTEAEWEYACRAGTMTTYSHGADESLLSRYAVFQSGKTEIPGSKFPNGRGLFDVHGNVWEWCQDWLYRENSEKSVTDPMGTTQGGSRALRGGFFSGPARFAQSDFRHFFLAGDRYNVYGLRVAPDSPLSRFTTDLPHAAKWGNCTLLFYVNRF